MGMRRAPRQHIHMVVLSGRRRGPEISSSELLGCSVPNARSPPWEHTQVKNSLGEHEHTISCRIGASLQPPQTCLGRRWPSGPCSQVGSDRIWCILTPIWATGDKMRETGEGTEGKRNKRSGEWRGAGLLPFLHVSHFPLLIADHNLRFLSMSLASRLSPSLRQASKTTICGVLPHRQLRAHIPHHPSNSPWAVYGKQTNSRASFSLVAGALLRALLHAADVIRAPQYILHIRQYDLVTTLSCNRIPHSV